MSGCRLVLVAANEIISRPVQAHLRSILGAPVALFSFHGIRDFLDPSIKGILLVAICSREDIEIAASLVREISLLQWSWKILMLELRSPVPRRRLSFLDPYVEARMNWPEQLPQLVRLIKKCRGRNRKFALAPNRNSLADRIAHKFLCHTPSLLRFARFLAAAATHDSTVLLTGETGSGKTYFARLIHELSPRKLQPLVTIRCGGLLPSYLEKEIFGSVNGSVFRPGKLEAAGEGTLVLDEIEALGLQQQAKLARVIETTKYEPVASNRSQFCRARIMVSSTRNLENAVEQGRFDLSLYNRLCGMAFHLPPLRERAQDIGPLARAITFRFTDKFGKRIFTISPKVVSALQAFDWPGNIRQLESVIQKAILSSSGSELLPVDLPKELNVRGSEPDENDNRRPSSLLQRREETERLAIEKTLEDCSNIRTLAARILGVSRVTLYKKMKKYGLLPLLQKPYEAERLAVEEALEIQKALENCSNIRTLAARTLGVSRVTLYKKMKKYGLLLSDLPEDLPRR